MEVIWNGVQMENVGAWNENVCFRLDEYDPAFHAIKINRMR